MSWNDGLSVVLAVVLGAAVGLERELSDKAAGLRTNVLICLGAAVFTMISRQIGSGQNDSVTRIAAQIVTGVGFLGAGAIIQDRGGVHGLTTAATIWLVASIGMACGANFYELAAVSTLIAMLVLIVFGKLAKSLGRYLDKHRAQSTPDEHQEPSDSI